MVADEMLLNGRYKLLRRIGSGGMAVVYQAQDLLLGRPVAVKMLHESFSGDEQFLGRFRQEAYSAAALQHPNIVIVHDIGQDGHRQYIVMEYVQGQTMKQIVRKYKAEGSTMPINRMLDLTVQICAGIGYAHRAGLVHCDVKPQNVIVTHDDRIKVADFGIARAMSEASQQVQDTEMWGTPQYFAPEQAAGQAPTPASDVYAIGVMMFEMLTGELPFAADSPTALALKHMNERPPLVSALNPNVPEQLELIIDKVLSKEPAGRYRTAGQLGSVLSSYRSGSQAETGPIPPPVVVPVVGQSVPASEQQTQIFSKPQQTVPSSTKPLGAGAYTTSAAATQAGAGYEDGATDWLAVGLGIMAVIALLGLIPLWIFVYLAYAG
ncbi:MAG: protein kinase [Candidatus Promineifilaceae bacterium]|nr:protein kinase [Candidatus Promineifilaceae bacterium]